MRAIFSSLTVVLIVAALLFGNCLSCPQMLWAWASHSAPHSCCHKPQPVSAGCHSQSMQHFVKAASTAHAPVLQAVAEAVQVTPPGATLLDAAPTPSPAEHAPPYVLALSSSLRI
ncbi:MAG TPA: hypothetical protein VLY04_08980 [Bryobacteraceae bacterium]|nr:hypothetical protein [Bryobacteraceae bacterium]